LLPVVLHQCAPKAWLRVASVALIVAASAVSVACSSSSIYGPSPGQKQTERQGAADATGTGTGTNTGLATGTGIIPTIPGTGGVVTPGGVIPGGVTPGTQLPPEMSGGSGGQTGSLEQRFTASNGMASTYKAIIPTDIGPQKAYGLTIHLHGDGGGDYDWLYEDNARIGLEHGLLGIVVRAPNNKCCWYEGGEANAKFLDDLIQNEFFVKYNIDKRRVYFSGVSGGSQFLTGQFIPIYGSRYNSGAVMLCGGPDNWQDSITSTPEFVRDFKLYWYSTQGDFLLDQVQEGISYYKNLGMQVGSEIRPSGDHCDFPDGVDGALAAKLPLVLH
jgi:hypothetical protein